MYVGRSCLVLEDRKKRARGIGREVGLCRRMDKGENRFDDDPVIVLDLVVLVLKSKDRRW